MKEIEVKTVKEIYYHIHGRDWKFVIKDHPECLDGFLLIEEHMEDKLESKITLPKDVLESMKDCIEFFINQQQ